MILEETKHLLRAHRISPNKLMGQNFMVEPLLYPKLCIYAEITTADVVLDVGAGFGWLTCFLADKCKSVVAIEKDPHISMVLRERVKSLNNVVVVEGNVLKVALPEFNKVVAIPPYYLSSHLVQWLFERKIDCAVLILQKEFANRLVASYGSEEYSWLTVVTNQTAAVELLDSVPKVMFYPHPEVDSIIVSLKSWRSKPFEIKDQAFFVRMMKWLFTQRNKKLGKAIAPFIKSSFKLSKQDAEKLALSLCYSERRVRELSPKDFGALANVLLK
ncbi:MAG: 16S rRNA (adenine(1518)-N(6)/adenine(1519)-N(6))-dimethyltransferase RsmA [Candidatus Bathyarchaeia archaeon]